MSYGNECRFCPHADPKREKDGEIRCKRYSQWVDPHSVCEERVSKISSHLLAELKEAMRGG